MHQANGTALSRSLQQEASAIAAVTALPESVQNHVDKPC